MLEGLKARGMGLIASARGFEATGLVFRGRGLEARG